MPKGAVLFRLARNLTALSSSLIGNCTHMPGQQENFLYFQVVTSEHIFIGKRVYKQTTFKKAA